MCGIAGVLVPDDGAIDERALRLMTTALAARGPDGQGFHLGPGVGLGHRRLAIIDVEGGRQPLYSEDRQVVVIVNGEIYNFVELRERLEGLGHVFATRSDSEVLVHGYEAWGDAVLDHVEGMFGLAIYDVATRRLLLARDRIGEKPLFWAELPGGGLAFASELRALRHYPGVDDSIDPAALARYLVYEYVPAPASMLRGVRKLEPGTALSIRAGASAQVQRYWDLPVAIDGSHAWRAHQSKAAARALRDELTRSVQQRLVSDVPLGIFLSGGIDSSLVAALAAKGRAQAIETFSIGFADPSFDESAAARSVARHIGASHHSRQLQANQVLKLLPAIGRLLDEPIGDSSIVPTHLLARFAREHVTVALGGDGGDELFLGYPTFVAEPVARLLLEQPAGTARAALLRASQIAASKIPVSLRYFSFDFKLKQFLKGAGQRGARRHQAWLASFAPQDALSTLAPDLAQAAGNELYDVIETRLARCASPDHWDRLSYFYLKGYLGDGVLTKVDRATMAVGLEARAPLLDSRVVGLACQMSPLLKLRGSQTKHVLRRAARGLVPPAILRRPKRGFAMPIARWLRHDLRALLEELLGAPLLRHQALFEPAPIRRLVDEHVTGRADHRKPLWTLLAFQGWWQSLREA